MAGRELPGTPSPSLFDERALALAPRALPPSPLEDHPPALPRAARVAFRAAGLGHSARGLLGELEGARLVRVDARHEVLSVPPAELARGAERAPDAALLLAAWRAATRPLTRPRLMGVVNVTPDSFSDGGDWIDPACAVEHGLRLAREGAELLDVGGESTRPGSEDVPVEVELERVLPVVAGLAGRELAVSVDTQKASVADAGLDAGARIVNDVSAGRFDPEMLPLVAARGADIVLMHMRGRPRDMQVDPRYADPVAEITEHLRARVAACLNAGIALARITLDPGIGFGKRVEDNVALIRRLPELRSLGLPLCLGVSRKAFLGRLSGVEIPKERLTSTAAAVTGCVLGGADVLRVHDVGRMREVMAVAQALAGRTGDGG